MMMEFNETIVDLRPPSVLKGVRTLYSDGFYELMSYYEFNERDLSEDEARAEAKTMLMNTFCKLENVERRILRKHGVDARGKLNFHNLT